MCQDEKKSVWDDEDEIRRMILEAEDNEVWRIEEADDSEGGPAPRLDLLKLRAKLDSGAAGSEAESSGN